MKKILLFATSVVFTGNIIAQQIIDFEEPVLLPDTSWFGQDQVIDGDTIYSSAFHNFELNYNSSWGSYTGWAISNITDTITTGYFNQFSAITGSGSSSDQYAINYISSWSNNRLFQDNFGLATAWTDMKITNTTFAYWSMKNGDSFAKPFGADTSAAGVNDGTNGEDWFLLTIYGLGWDSLKTGDSVNFYLADYRFANDVDDYIIDSWETVDLSPLGNAVGLDFVLTSSDTSGGSGMNTPSYIAVDKIRFWAGGDLSEYKSESISVYPNPTNGNLTIATEINEQLFLYDLTGKLIKTETANSQIVNWDILDLDSGIYQLIIVAGDEKRQTKVVKQ